VSDAPLRQRRRPLPAAVLSAAVLVAGMGCTSGELAPAELDTRHDACAWCRMSVSQPRFAAQIIAPGEEPRFFDDIGCLADYARSSRDLPNAALAFVADHRTGAWARAGAAVIVRCPAIATPMASGLVAFADGASREADDAARGCVAVDAATLLPASFLRGEP
jgi:copper chaperone NosL